MKIEAWEMRNFFSGPVGLLGNGETLAVWDLPGFSKHMPLIGINRSWVLIETKWRCYVDGVHHEEIISGEAPAPEVAFTVRDPNRAPLPCDSVEIHWRPITQEDKTRRFRGSELDGGSYGPFAGYFALELARWMGFNPIYLFGFDGVGGHFDAPHFDRPAMETRQWNELFREARRSLDRDGVQVINLNPLSAIDAFEFAVDTQEKSGIITDSANHQ